MESGQLNAESQTLSASREADLASLLRDFTRTTEAWTRTYARMQGEMARLREELHQKNALLKSQERLAVLGQMAAGVAHEIRNPLGGIQLSANLLQRLAAGRPEELAVIERILVAVRHMERVVRQTLTFAGGMTPAARVCDVRGLVDSALAIAAPGEQVQVECRIPEALSCRVDPDLARQMLANLIVNARDAMEGAGTIRFAAFPEAGGAVRIEISDTGPGVPPELRDRLFDPFVTTKASGGGLGLSVVWRIVEAHGGEIRLVPKDGEGACFQIRLPGAARSGGTRGT